jgi:hypothetical protein
LNALRIAPFLDRTPQYSTGHFCVGAKYPFRFFWGKTSSIQFLFLALASRLKIFSGENLDRLQRDGRIRILLEKRTFFCF